MVYEGSLVVKAAGGYAEPGRKAASLIVLAALRSAPTTPVARTATSTCPSRRGVIAWANSASNGKITTP